jgi:hypothetical protein
MTRGLWLGVAILVVGAINGRPAQAQFGTGIDLPAPDSLVDVPPGVLVSLSTQESTGRVERALATYDDWKLGHLPLSEFAERLRQRYQIAVVVDETSLQDEGIDPSTPIRWVQGQARLETVLTLGLKPLGLSFHVRDDVLVILTSSTACEAVFPRIYPVRDLVRDVDGLLDDYYELAYLIMNCTEDLWRDNGTGDGVVAVSPIARSLVIHQSWGIHREIERLLFTLRKVRELQQLSDPVTSGPNLASRPIGEPLSAVRMFAPPSPTPAPRRQFTDWRQPRVDRGR